MFEKFSVGMEASPKAWMSLVAGLRRHIWWFFHLKKIFLSLKKTFVWIRIRIQRQPGSGFGFSDSLDPDSDSATAWIRIRIPRQPGSGFGFSDSLDPDSDSATAWIRIRIQRQPRSWFGFSDSLDPDPAKIVRIRISEFGFETLLSSENLWLFPGWRNMIICRMTQYPAAEWSLTTPLCSPQPTGSSHRKWFRNAAFSSSYFSRFFFLLIYHVRYFQHCFICCPSDSADSTDAGIEPRTVATTALAFRRSHSARSHPLDLWSY